MKYKYFRNVILKKIFWRTGPVWTRYTFKQTDSELDPRRVTLNCIYVPLKLDLI